MPWNHWGRNWGCKTYYSDLKWRLQTPSMSPPLPWSYEHHSPSAKRPRMRGHTGQNKNPLSWNYCAMFYWGRAAGASQETGWWFWYSLSLWNHDFNPSTEAAIHVISKIIKQIGVKYSKPQHPLKSSLIWLN